MPFDRLPTFADARTELCRRAFLGQTTLGLGSIALASFLQRQALAADDTPAFKLPKARAKRVIMVFLAGGLSQMDLFDEKPILNQRRGEELPDSVRRGQRITGVTEKQLQDAPAFSDDAWSNRNWEAQTYKHYNVPPYWA